jgi:uncharacterized protein (UPF0179 family)
MSQVTLVGTRIANVGEEFVYHGEAPGCEGCPYRDQCLNLTEGVEYRIEDIRDNAQTLDCAVHEGDVRAVEVEPASVRANVPSKNAYAGSKASLAGPCPHVECPSHEFCVADGVEYDEERQIQEIVGDPPHDTCALDRDLTLVEFASEE